jgi:DUF1680 family protein
MKKSVTLFLTIMASLGAMAQRHGYPITQVPFTQVKIAENTFLGQRVKAAREVTVPLAFSKCESEHRIDNFVKAAHPSASYNIDSFMGFPFDDTDVYKTIEGASYILQTYPDKKLKAYIDSVLTIVGAAQEPDGYLYTARTINPAHPQAWAGDKRWVKEEVLSHELYNLGHMVDAACAHYQATGSDKFLNIARRYADCVVREVGSGSGQATVVPGHQIAEMALARLYVITGEKKYLDEAKYMLDFRGKTSIRNPYSQSHIPVVDQKEAVGHAVRAGYMYAGMADVAALTGDSAYIRAIDAIWQNIVGKKLYITGGVGARHEGEAYGDNYELPNMTAYNETCAAIAEVYLNQRMFLLHGQAKYIDVLERTLYNGLISGMSVDGGRFFYPNPLASDGKYKFNADGTTTRQPWFGCACCPSNLSRFIPSLPGYMYAVKGRDVYVNLFAGNTATIMVEGKPVTLQMTTNYPWDGNIQVKVLDNKAGRFNLKVRIPGWVQGQPVPSDLYSYTRFDGATYSIAVNGKACATDGVALTDGYYTLEGPAGQGNGWKKGSVVTINFPMEVRTVKAHEKVADDRGRVAVERGPLVYCAEGVDNGGVDVRQTLVNTEQAFAVVPDYGIKNTEGDGKTFMVTALKGQGQQLTTRADGSVDIIPQPVTLIPYYAWNHRGAGFMEVWLANGVEELLNK